MGDLRALVASHGLSAELPADVEAEARAFARAPGIDDPALVDLTHLAFATIDEVTSRDLDQAVFVEPDGEGWRVWYALADASWYVRRGTRLYAEALARGATYYLPGLVVPMLPKGLSEDLVSLGPAVDRRALVVELTLDARGACTRTRFHRARVRSRHKLAFDSVQAFLDGAAVAWDPAVQASLRALPAVGRLRLQLADERDVVRYRRSEVEVRAEGPRFVALDGPRNDVERYNEQISLLANVEGARFLREGDHPHDAVDPIYRVHEPPGAERLHELEHQIRAIVHAHGLPDDAAWAPSDEGLAAYLRRVPADAVGRAIHRQAMVANRPSRHTAEPGAHHGVGADVYGRFTAPMREVVGIWLHAELFEKLGPERGAGAPDPTGRDAVIDASNRARELQRQLDREVNRLVLDALFEGDASAGRSRAGTVLGLTSSRVHVQLDAPPIDVKVYVAHLDRAWGTTLALQTPAVLADEAGRVRLRVGDRVQVHVVGHDRRRDRWNLGLEPAEVSPGPARR